MTRKIINRILIVILIIIMTVPNIFEEKVFAESYKEIFEEENITLAANNLYSYNVEYYFNGKKIYTETKQGTKRKDVLVIPLSPIELGIAKDSTIRIKKGFIDNKQEDYVKLDEDNKTVRYYYSNTVVIDDVVWTRSSENEKHYVSTTKWTWNDVKDIDTPLVDGEVNHNNYVWDGQFDNRYYGQYKNQNLKSDYATWRCISSWWKYAIRRFKAVITIPQNFTGNDVIRMKTVNQDAYIDINGGNILPINDNIYVFVYKPTDVINNSNYLKHLAFWSGTSNQNGVKCYFNGIEGTPAHKVNASELKHTDGWYCEADVDNVAKFMEGAKPGDKYIIDIFVEDYSGGGGMDKPQFEFIKTYAPTTQSDTYIAGSNNELRVDSSIGLLSSDSSNYVKNGELSASIITSDKTIQNKNGDNISYNLKDSNGTLAGTISFSDSKDKTPAYAENNGTFIFTPASGYVGQVEFSYICKDKGNNQETKENVVINVLPSITVNHRYVEYDFENEIVKEYKSILKTEKVYGVPQSEKITWNEDWVISDDIKNELKVIAPEKHGDEYYSQYEFKNSAFAGYVFIRSKNAKGEITENDSLAGEFTTENRDLEFYYTKPENINDKQIIINVKDNTDKSELTDQVVISNQTIGLSYSIKPSDYITSNKTMGYSYNGKYSINDGDVITQDKDSNITGTLNDDIVINIYMDRNTYHYYVEYYKNNQMQYRDEYSGVYKEKINTGLESLISKHDLVNNGWTYLANKTENYPLNISYKENNNVIRLYYEKEVKVSGGVYLNNNFQAITGFVPNCCYPCAIKIKGKGTYAINMTSTDADIKFTSSEFKLNSNKVLIEDESTLKFFLSASPKSDNTKGTFSITITVNDGDVSDSYKLENIPFTEPPVLE